MTLTNAGRNTIMFYKWRATAIQLLSNLTERKLVDNAHKKYQNWCAYLHRRIAILGARQVVSFPIHRTKWLIVWRDWRGPGFFYQLIDYFAFLLFLSNVNL